MYQVQLATLGVWELLVILAIVMLIFGAGKLPQLGDSLGKGIRNFRKSFKDDPREVEAEAKRVKEPDSAAQLPSSGTDAINTDTINTDTINKEAQPTESRVDKS